jgi:hypothetical protein
LARHRDVARWRRRISTYCHVECRSWHVHRDPHALGRGNTDRSRRSDRDRSCRRHPDFDSNLDRDPDGNADRNAN